MEMKQSLRAAAMCASVLTASCMTKRDGDTLANEVRALDERVTKELGGVESVANSARKTNAELGADVDALRAEVRQAKGEASLRASEAETLRRQLESLEVRLTALEGKTAAIDTKPTIVSPDELWTNGELAYRAARYNDAADLWKKLTVQFPGHSRADDAFFYRGEAFMKLAQVENAIREYQRVFERYADGPLADDALLRAAEAAYSQKACTEARAYLGALKQKYPKSDVGAKGDALDKTIKAAKATAKCTS